MLQPHSNPIATHREASFPCSIESWRRRQHKVPKLCSDKQCPMILWKMAWHGLTVFWTIPKSIDYWVSISGSVVHGFWHPKTGTEPQLAWNLGSCWVAIFQRMVRDSHHHPVSMELLRQVYSAHPQPLPYALPRLDTAWREGIVGCAKKLKVRSTARIFVHMDASAFGF